MRRFLRKGHNKFLVFGLCLLVFYIFLVDSSVDQDTLLKCRLAPSLCERKPPSYSPNPRTATQARIETAKLGQIKKLYKAADPNRLAMGHQFYKKIMQVIVSSKPNLKKPLDSYYFQKFQAERFEFGKAEQIFPESYLLQFLQISDEEEHELKISHQYALDNLPNTAPEGLYSGDGIVIVGGGKFNWLALLNIKRLRTTGCTLPVEVLIPSFEEFEIDVCTSVFPSLNAKCIYMPMALFKDEVSRYGENSQLTFKGYQYKCLAVLLSSFENVLLLDGDNIVINSPQEILTSEPFSSSGLVVWPDFWRRSTSPKFYTIAGVEVSKTKLTHAYLEVFHGYFQQTHEITPQEALLLTSFHERLGSIPDPSTESGQLLISKKTHLKALLLAFYYNSFGPDFYYPLFSQGASGEGDKETFLAGAVILNEPFYQVGSFVLAIGEFEDGEFFGHGMGQADPGEDYRRSLEFDKIVKSYEEPERSEKLKALPRPKLMFLHANYPKLNPWELRLSGTTINARGRHRLYGNGLIQNCGRDVELEIWDDIQELICGKTELVLDALKTTTREALCNEINEQRLFLLATSASLND